MSEAQVRELVQTACGKGIIARLAACELAAYYRRVLGYSALEV